MVPGALMAVLADLVGAVVGVLVHQRAVQAQQDRAMPVAPQRLQATRLVAVGVLEQLPHRLLELLPARAVLDCNQISPENLLIMQVAEAEAETLHRAQVDPVAVVRAQLT